MPVTVIDKAFKCIARYGLALAFAIVIAASFSVSDATAQDRTHPALKAFDEGQFDKAIRLLTREIDARAGKPETNKAGRAALYVVRAQAFAAVGKTADAIDDCTSALELNPGYYAAYLLRARLHLAKRRFDLAGRDATEAHRLNPKEPSSLITRAKARLLAGDRSGARSDLAAAVLLDGGEAKAFYTLALAFFEEDEWKTALSALDRVLEIEPNNADALLLRGKAHQRLKSPERAFADYNRAVTLNPKNAEAISYRAAAQMALGKLQAAEADFARAVELEPLNAVTRGLWGMSFCNLRDYRRCLQEIDTARQIDPDAASVRGYRSRALSGADRMDEALGEAMVLAMSDDPDPLYIGWMQQQLAAKGFDPGPVDGVLGPKTAAAARDWLVTLRPANGERSDRQPHETAGTLGIAVAVWPDGASALTGQPPKTGALVISVPQASAGKPGGLRHGDLILGVGNSVVTNPDDFEAATAGHSVGYPLPITISRGGQRLSRTVTLSRAHDHVGIDAEGVAEFHKRTLLPIVRVALESAGELEPEFRAVALADIADAFAALDDQANVQAASDQAAWLLANHIEQFHGTIVRLVVEKIGRHSGPETVFRLAKRLPDPNRSCAYAAVVTLHAEAGAMNEAALVFDRIDRDGRVSARCREYAQINLAKAHAIAGDLDIAFFNVKAIDRPSSRVIALAFIAEDLEKQERHAESQKAMKRAWQEYAETSPTERKKSLGFLAMAQAKTGDLEGALQSVAGRDDLPGYVITTLAREASERGRIDVAADVLKLTDDSKLREAVVGHILAAGRDGAQKPVVRQAAAGSRGPARKAELLAYAAMGQMRSGDTETANAYLSTATAYLYGSATSPLKSRALNTILKARLAVGDHAAMAEFVVEYLASAHTQSDAEERWKALRPIIREIGSNLVQP